MYKVLRELQDGRLVSAFAHNGMEIEYTPGAWTSAKPEASERGYNILVFIDLQEADEFARQMAAIWFIDEKNVPKNIVIYSVECKENVNFPPNYIADFYLFPNTCYPSGTALKEIRKLIPCGFNWGNSPACYKYVMLTERISTSVYSLEDFDKKETNDETI